MHETLVARPLEAPVVPETVSPIKPSEALRLGRLHRPIQIHGPLFQGDAGACALGAIAIGRGYRGSTFTCDAFDFLVRSGVDEELQGGIVGTYEPDGDDARTLAWLEGQGL